MFKERIDIYKPIKSSKIKSKIGGFLIVIALFMFAFIPTSNNTIIYGNNWIVLVWLILSIFVITISWVNKFDNDNIFILVFLLLLYIIIVTFIELVTNINARISIARIAPIMSLFYLSSIKITQNVSYKLMERLLDILCITIILWNVFIIIDYELVKEFTRNNYSQYYANALYYSMLRGKPVMSFGVHTYASYFYLLTFYLSFISALKTKKIKYYIYCSFIVVFTFLLASNTSLIYGIIMLVMLFILLIHKPIFMGLFFTIVIGVLISFAPYLSNIYSMMRQSELNGFLARYTGEHTVFDNNIEVIKNSLGIGFTIPDNLQLGYSDSGYMVYMTMGNIPFTIGLYFLIFKFLKKNLSRKNFWFICFIVFSFEIALPATFSYRFPFVIIFVIYYLRSLENNNKQYVV